MSNWKCFGKDCSKELDIKRMRWAYVYCSLKCARSNEHSIECMNCFHNYPVTDFKIKKSTNYYYLDYNNCKNCLNTKIKKIILIFSDPKIPSLELTGITFFEIVGNVFKAKDKGKDYYFPLSNLIKIEMIYS